MSSTKAGTVASMGSAAGGRPIEPVAHFTVAERAARGKAARAEVPRRAHAAWEPSPVRADPVDLLEEQAKTRVEELVPIRYGRMLVSPFTFYRGAAYVMAADLAGMPRTGLHVQLCGDAHLSNFGVYAAPDRRLVFDINDFDETLPGPFEWDVKRLVASFAVAGPRPRLRRGRRRAINLAVGRSYREAMAGFAVDGDVRPLVLARRRRRPVRAILVGAEREGGRAGERNVAKARTKDSLAAFEKLTRMVDGEPRIVSDPPLIVPISELVHRRAGDRGRTRRDPRVPADVARRPPSPARALPASSTRPGRSSASAASGRERSSCSSSAATTTTRCSSR